MIELTEAYVKSTAFNDSSFTNGKKLVSSKKIINTYITKEKDLIFGECKGSGKSNYKVSVDFMNPSEPVCRCSCPSRQIPCKHATALLYAYVQEGSSFAEGEVPEEVASKREKIEKRVEKKKSEETKPKKVNVTAFVKKMKLQLEGIGKVDQFIEECLMSGLASVSLSQIKTYKKELVKELGNYYLPTHQVEVERILSLLESKDKKEADEVAIYKEVTQLLSNLVALNEVSKKVLEESITEKKAVEKESADAFTKMGYVWKMEELKALGFAREKGQLMQLGFYDYYDEGQKAYIDKGFYLDLANEGEICESVNIRPLKALKHIKAEDSQFELLEVTEYVVYPGEVNRRVRWEGFTPRTITKEDVTKVREVAKTDYKTVLKEVKNQMKEGLGKLHPVVLVRYERLVKREDQFVLIDEAGETIILGQTQKAGMDNTLLPIPFVLEEADLKGQVMLGMFEYEEDKGRLMMQPISIVTETEVKRLLG